MLVAVEEALLTVLTVAAKVEPTDCRLSWSFDIRLLYDDESKLDEIHIVLRDHRLEKS